MESLSTTDRRRQSTKKARITIDRMKKFLVEDILNKIEGKVIITDNASVHRNKGKRESVEKKNKLFLSLPYQHYTNAIETWFSVMKSKLIKKDGIKLNELIINIGESIKEIEKEKYEKIIRGSYRREKEYKKSGSRKKELKKIQKLGKIKFLTV